MKCPKCGYLGFEDVDRCRHCGYDFSLTTTPHPAELPLQPVDRLVSPLDDAARLDASAPFIRTSPPRQPLAVRRATPDTPRLRPSLVRPTPLLDLALPEGISHAPRVDESKPAVSSPTATRPEAAAEPAGAGARLAAVAIDALILLAIDAVVVYLTMQVCGLTLADVELLPRAPLLTFLIGQNLSYFVVFTAGGQTLGKMATGIRVVLATDNTSPDFGHSALRTLVWVAMAAPAGLGFVSILPGRERRGLHDLCAGTKVVRASV